MEKINLAVEAFWGVIANAFPEMRSGDSQLSGEDIAAMSLWINGEAGDNPIQEGVHLDVPSVYEERIGTALTNAVLAAGEKVFGEEMPLMPVDTLMQLDGCVRHVLHFNLPVDQGAIEAQIESAVQTRAKHGYKLPAVITLRFIGDGLASLGFVFQAGLKPGDVTKADDGSWAVVIAVV